MPVTPISLTTADQRTLAARAYLPEGPARATALIAPAMGVSQGFYAPLASWLASEGVATLTVDYRGTGASLDRPLRQEAADILTWTRQDLPAALAATHGLAADVPRIYVGHSLGGQVLPLVPGADHVDVAVTIASGSGWWKHNTPELRRKVWLLWHVAVPIATPIFGYFPGKSLRMVGDLPGGVIREWRAWCHHPRYLLGVVPEATAAYEAVKIPVHIWSFDDDELLSRAAIDDLARGYTAARVVRHHEPRPEGRKIGHFGFFHRDGRHAMWRERFEAVFATLPA